MSKSKGGRRKNVAFRPLFPEPAWSLYSFKRSFLFPFTPPGSGVQLPPASGPNSPRGGGLEASRNHQAIYEKIQISLQVKNQPAKQAFNPDPYCITMKSFHRNSAQQETHRVDACAMGVRTSDHTNGNLRNLLRKNSHGGISTKHERLNMMRPHRREHPQEELLQRFKEEFKAWQEARVWELYGSHLNGRNNQSEAPDGAARRASSLRKPVEYYSPSGTWRSSRPENMSKEHLSSLVEARKPRNRENANDLGRRFPELKFSKRVDRSSSPTRIVILQPSSDRSEDSEEQWPCSSREDSIKYFLEERMPKWVPFSHVRERGMGDLGTTLLQTGSTRSYGSRCGLEGSNPAEFAERDGQRLLPDGLRNINGRRPSTGSSVLGDYSYYGDVKGELEVRAQSFREGQVSQVVGGGDQNLSANLVRCFSAPMSETALGRLLLREQDNLTGAHIQRQLEPVEEPTVEVRKLKKDVFNLRGKISYLRRALTLPGKLFRRKNRPAYDPAEDKTDPIETTATPPSLKLHSGIARARRDNSTEVPPSPASICGSSYEEVWKPGFPSPVSPLEMSFNEDYPIQISEEIGSETPAPGCEEASNGEQLEELHEDEDMKSHEENYLRHILLTSGLYNQPLNLIIALCNSPTEPLAEGVFEEVEKDYIGSDKVNDDVSPLETVSSRRMLFDLLNEELFCLVSSPISSSMKRRPLRGGEELMKSLWQRLERSLRPTAGESSSLESLISNDLRVEPWIPHKGMDAAGEAVEGMILSQLIDEFIDDLCVPWLSDDCSQ
ncbi:unnamed protein product [Spirodela intermedia]|uniref:DUF4378 domain-containing protein n=1 Tax=Spirodela intermedia TaxID=51605 RepID=A0A7I8JB07_SPIIN|nr:unnamed protein product [Spirodela intermedia]CAA6666652.1 unnamed protein product [Spirodela intermedia]